MSNLTKRVRDLEKKRVHVAGDPIPVDYTIAYLQGRRERVPESVWVELENAYKKLGGNDNGTDK